MVCSEAAHAAKGGDRLRVDVAAGSVENLTQGTRHEADAFPPFMQELIGAGGLLPYVKGRLSGKECESCAQ